MDRTDKMKHYKRKLKLRPKCNINLSEDYKFLGNLFYGDRNIDVYEGPFLSSLNLFTKKDSNKVTCYMIDMKYILKPLSIHPDSIFGRMVKKEILK